LCSSLDQCNGLGVRLVIAARPDDPEAVYLSGAAGDGTADDSAAVQHAIDAVHDLYLARCQLTAALG
jgi:hypothetical protein